jgi:CheY-like chemotaxis protein
VPKILVADDNSNVQRTVTLALSDLGVEVVAVNNGEAAVRKLANFTPDLILADIFMPVRNGYEVCEFVKQNPQFAQTPVVLLVGAFDPFDEREAQRVGADGILKKPFVPPDPLIAMVRTLLDRVMATRPVPAPVATGPTATTQRSIASSAAKVLPDEGVDGESAEIDFGSRGRVEFGEGERPVAFGDMFEAPAVNVDASAADATDIKDDSLIVTSKRDAALGDPGFWRKDEDDEAPAIESAIPTEDGPQLVERPWESAISTADEPEAKAPIPVETSTETPSETTFEIVREDQVQTLSTANPDSILQDPAAHATLTVDASKPANLAANPLDWMASVPPLASDKVEEDAAEFDEPEAEIPVENSVADSADIPAAPSLVKPDASPEVTQVLTPLETAKSKQADAIPESPAVTMHPVAVDETLSDSSEEVVPVVLAKAAEPAATDKWTDLATIVKEEAKSMTEQSAPLVVTSPAAASSEAVPPVGASPSQPGSTDPAVVEAVVQRVMQKMSPQVIDIITREFLRPVVQALVKREIEKH